MILLRVYVLLRKNVRTTKVGGVHTCSIEPKGFSVAERWISERRSMWERRFDRLGDLLAEPEK
jgi:hypothetical protein